MDWYFILSLIFPTLIGTEFVLITILMILCKIEEKKGKKELAEKEALKARIEQENKGIDKDLIKYFNYIADAIDPVEIKVSEKPTFSFSLAELKTFDADMLKYYNYKVNGGENI